MYEPHDDEIVELNDGEPEPGSAELMFFWPEDRWMDPWEVAA
jgi:hypothetical protein